MNPQAEVLQAYLARRFRNRLIAGAIALVIVVIGATISKIQENKEMAIYYDQNHGTQTATTDHLAGLYGSLPIDLCNGTGLVEGTGSLSIGSKLLVVQVSDSSIYDAYQSALPNQATSIMNLDGVVCIQENRNTIFRKDGYLPANDPNTTPSYFCNHHRVDFDVTVVNAKSKQMVAQNTFQGSEVDGRLGCPQNYDLDMDWDIYSDPPTPATIADWLRGVVTYN